MPESDQNMLEPLQHLLANLNATLTRMEQTNLQIAEYFRKTEQREQEKEQLENNTPAQSQPQEERDGGEDSDSFGSLLQDESIESLRRAGRNLIRGEEIDFPDLTQSLHERISTHALEEAILKPLENFFSNGLPNVFNQLFGGIESNFFGSIVGSLFHQGGIVGETPAPTRSAPAALFFRAPRLHDGGIAGSLAGNEIPAILERGEIVIPREQAHRIASGAHRSDSVRGANITLNMTVQTPDIGSFRASQGQIGAEMARGLERIAQKNL